MTERNQPSPRPEAAVPWPAIAAVGALAVAALMLAILVLRDGTDGSPQTVGSGSPSAGPDGASESPAAASTDLASPSGAATPPVGPGASAAIADAWTAVATYSEPGQRYVFGDMASGTDGIVAVGTRYVSETRSVFGPPPAHQGVVWRSIDGTEWSELPAAATFDQVELTQLFHDADGALIAIGDTWIGLERTSAAWASPDGESWEPIVLDGMPAGAWISRLVSGASGFLASAHVGAQSNVLYSADGRQWESVLPNATGVNDLGAGDEGFVASIFMGDGAPVIVASGDGLQWFNATPPAVDAFMVAPRGRDWLGMTSTFGDVVSSDTWRSANGLEWGPIGGLTLGIVESPGVSCREAPALLHGLPSMVLLGTTLLGPCSEGAVIGAGGSYASVEGGEWSALPFGEQATAAGAVQLDDRVVVATDTRTNRAAVIGVTFWIREAP